MRIKRVCSVGLSLLFGTMLIGCGTSEAGKVEVSMETEEPVVEEESYQVAYVIDIGNLNDASYNQGAWEGLQEYCDTNNLTYKYFKSSADDTAAFQETIENAIGDNTEVVVCPGYLFETPVYNVQEKYPDVKFILIDGEPHSEDYSDYKTTENTMPVLFHEDQVGFMAGYAAVKDGNTSLGFMGGVKLPAVMRYGYGYLAGAEYAAEELGTEVHVNYIYTGSFDATPEVESMAAEWYDAGTDVIFGCGGRVGNSVMMAAEAREDKKVIGVDVDQNSESITVMTSAMKMLSVSVFDALTSVYDGNFPGGKTTTMDITNDGIAMDTARFQTFSQEEYDGMKQKLADGEVSVDVDIEKEPKELGLEHVVIEVIE